MKLIPLSKGEFAMIDDSDFESVSKYKWFLVNGYAGKAVNGRRNAKEYLHRFLVKPEITQSIDHANGDKLDNRRFNLRVCSHSENLKNQKTRTDNTSGFKGVSRHRKKWMAYIELDYKRTYLGHFTTKEEAALAYNKAAVKMHKEFAKLNRIT